MAVFCIKLSLLYIHMEDGDKKPNHDEITRFFKQHEKSIVDNNLTVHKYINYIDAILYDFPVKLVYVRYDSFDNSIYFEIMSDDPTTTVAELQLILGHANMLLVKWIDVFSPIVCYKKSGYFSFKALVTASQTIMK